MPSVEKNEEELAKEEAESTKWPKFVKEFEQCMDCGIKIPLNVKRCDPCQEKIYLANPELRPKPEVKFSPSVTTDSIPSLKGFH